MSKLSKIITTITLFVFANSYSQTASIRNLIFEGAGVRGIAYSGAIRELESENILQNVQRVGGTSSGAITALLLSIGYSAEEITNIVNSTSYKKFNDGRFFLLAASIVFKNTLAGIAGSSLNNGFQD